MPQPSETTPLEDGIVRFCLRLAQVPTRMPLEWSAAWSAQRGRTARPTPARPWPALPTLTVPMERLTPSSVWTAPTQTLRLQGWPRLTTALTALLVSCVAGAVFASSWTHDVSLLPSLPLFLSPSSLLPTLLILMYFLLLSLSFFAFFLSLFLFLFLLEHKALMLTFLQIHRTHAIEAW